MDEDEPRKPRPGLSAAARVTLIYLALSLAWIVFSDRAVLALFDSPQALSRVQTYKGLAFVLLSAGIIYLLVASAIAALKRSQEQLGLSERRYRTLYDSTPVMLFTVRGDGIISSVNAFGAQQLGYRREELIGKSLFDIVHPDDRRKVRRLVADLHDGAGLETWELRKIKQDGSVLWSRDTARLIGAGEGGRVMLMAAEDISEARRLSAELAYQSIHDGLTGLANRAQMESRLQRLVEAARSSGSEHALIYLDLDQFKVINDTVGHVAGDEMLRQIARRLAREVPAPDMVARIGGDEFAVLVEGPASVAAALSLAERLRDAIADATFSWQGHRFKLSVSMGLVAIDRDSESATTVLSLADAACFVAKDAGRNRIHVHDPSDDELNRRHGEMQWVPRIHEALDQGRFEPAFQLIAPLAGAGEGLHFEILVRMRASDGRLIPPGEFLPAAERYGLSQRIDRWVVDAVFSWLRDQPGLLERVEVCAINLSGQSIGDEAFLRHILERLEAREIPPRKICFEITETAAIANLHIAAGFVEALRDRGVRVALDDFGSGLSSFAYLKNLAVDYLKIDGSFVRGMVDDPMDYAMVKSIHEIGKVMGKQTIAEFVENEAILARLRELGVDFAQGYGVARPRPLSEI